MFQSESNVKWTPAYPKRKKRNCLTLQKKIEVIKASEKNPGIKVRELAEIFYCGKTQIAKVLKDYCLPMNQMLLMLWLELVHVLLSMQTSIKPCLSGTVLLVQ